jgi:hypothetical protein
MILEISSPAFSDLSKRCQYASFVTSGFLSAEVTCGSYKKYKPFLLVSALFNHTATIMPL